MARLVAGVLDAGKCRHVEAGQTLAALGPHPTAAAGTWQRSSAGDPDLDQIACPTARLCLAVDTNGDLVGGTR
jgi:hypothetical protein